MSSSTKKILLAATGLVLIAGSACTQAPSHSYAIRAGDLGAALEAYARQSDLKVIVASDVVAGRTTAGATGMLSDRDALDKILSGSGLHAETVAGGLVLRPDNRGETAGTASPTGSDIVVTGTRIRGSGPIGSPVTVIDRSTIEQSGRATVADYIQTLPQNFGGGANESLTGTTARNGASANTSYGSSINLRGLGTASTLVLFDGNRPALGGVYGAFTDTSLIPSEAIDRIEILTDGASAIYGTDAVAGVVNIRFRNHYDGFEAHLYSGTADGSFGQQQVSQIAGKRWSNGGVVLAYQFDHRDSLPGSDRRASTEDLRPWGGPDLRSPYAIAPNITAADGSIYAVSPAAGAGRITSADLIPGATNLIDNQKRVDLLPRQTTHSVYAAADQNIVPGLSLFAHVLYARRSFRIDRLPRDQAIEVPASNPFYVDPIGTGEPISVERDFETLVGQPHSSGMTTGLSATGGVQGDLGTWHYEVSGSYGREHETNNRDNEVNYSRLSDLLNDTDPATAFDPFGANSQAAADAIRGSEHNSSNYTVWSATARADGTLFDLPAGPVKLAVGAEHRREILSTSFEDDVFSETPETSTLDGTPNHRHINSLYAELAIPLLDGAGGKFPGKLDLSLAGRMDWYSDVGRTQNPKVGISWKPLDGLTLRGSFGTSFRAPGFTENIGASENYFIPQIVVDPASPTGMTGVIGEYGNAAQIGPERATTFTAGADFTPRQIPGFKLSATWFAIDYRDRIGTAGYYDVDYLRFRNIYGGLIKDNPSAAAVAALYASPNFYNFYNVPASSITAIIDGTTRNLSKQRITGVDLDLNYQRPFAGGTVQFGLNGTRLIAFDQQITSEAPKTSILSTFANPVRLRFRGHAGWSNGELDLTTSVNYTGSYSNNVLVPAEHVKSWTTVDAEVGYTFPKATPFGRAHVALDATNLLNKAPPYINNTAFDSTLAYDPGAANAIGRTLSVQATFSW